MLGIWLPCPNYPVMVTELRYSVHQYPFINASPFTNDAVQSEIKSVYAISGD